MSDMIINDCTAYRALKFSVTGSEPNYQGDFIQSTVISEFGGVSEFDVKVIQRTPTTETGKAMFHPSVYKMSLEMKKGGVYLGFNNAWHEKRKLNSAGWFIPIYNSPKESDVKNLAVGFDYNKPAVTCVERMRIKPMPEGDQIPTQRIFRYDVANAIQVFDQLETPIIMEQLLKRLHKVQPERCKGEGVAGLMMRRIFLKEGKFSVEAHKYMMVESSDIKTSMKHFKSRKTYKQFITDMENNFCEIIPFHGYFVSPNHLPSKVRDIDDSKKYEIPILNGFDDLIKTVQGNYATTSGALKSILTLRRKNSDRSWLVKRAFKHDRKEQIQIKHELETRNLPDEFRDRIRKRRNTVNKEIGK